MAFGMPNYSRQQNERANDDRANPTATVNNAGGQSNYKAFAGQGVKLGGEGGV
eukprot:CAMPEP_0205823372 /NCGR_PEP_ID=MMETSP0206-20130828/16242_1 /ASSEMBLY_ACC=CAM_ASM_000279 /TAXON_ID=36767 /ORGANISM="Euplotes focardii, Strain TN1" /LENGTH=52 /DNA_ID=CAMNT_0053120475 /DNA_START=767 /DNA_END=925 /DNA_ORIENTATION=+